jgi:cytoskeleton protein RodZ
VLQHRRSNLTQGKAMMSSPEHTGGGFTAPAVATRVGAELREARERLGWTLPAVATHLRIRQPFLLAIEEGRIGELPGNAYAVGFVRTYAQALGLDPDEIARRVRAEADDVNRKTELSFPAPVPERGVPAGAVVLLGAALAIVAYAGWYRMSGREPGNEPVRQVPPSLAQLAEPPAPPAPPPAAPSAPAALAGTAPGAAPSAAGPADAATTAEAVPAAPPPIATPTAANAASALPAGTRILLRARTDAWMQVRDRQGQVLLNRVLRPGETWPVPPDRQLLLTTGNAGGTDILVDGVTTASLGNDGAVRRDLPLDADAIKDGRLAAVAAPAPAPAPVVRSSPRQQ